MAQLMDIIIVKEVNLKVGGWWVLYIIPKYVNINRVAL